VSQCSSCRAAIIWATTPRGKNISLDVAQVAGGNVELRSGVAFVVKPEPGVVRYRSHFATCPNAGEHRQPRLRREPPAPPPPESKRMLEQLKQKSKERP
jgi:hypothetical protein